jgi:hypothetical protein
LPDLELRKPVDKEPLPMITRLAQVIILVGLATLSHAQAISRSDVPDKIKAPAGEEVILVARASGSQV